MKRNLILIAVSSLLIFLYCFSMPAAAADSVSVSLYKGIYVPVKTIADSFGLKFNLGKDKVSFELTYDSITVSGKIGSKELKKEGKTIILAHAPIMQAGNLQAPYELFTKAFALRVKPDTAKGVAVISIPPPMLVLVQHETISGRDRVKLKATKPMTYNSFILLAPSRIVIDINAELGQSIPQVVKVGSKVLEKIRVSRFDQSTVRVVIDLINPVGYKAMVDDADKTSVLIDLNIAVNEAGLTRKEGIPVLNIEMSSTPEYNVFQLHNPERVVLDVKNATLVTKKTELALSDPLVKKIRLSQNLPDSVRIVLELERQVPYNVLEGAGEGGDREGLRLEFANLLKGISIRKDKSSISLDFNQTSSLKPEINYFNKDERAILLTFGETTLDRAVADLSFNDGFIDSIRFRQIDQSKVEVKVNLLADLPYTMSESQSGIVSLRLSYSDLSGRVIVIDPGHGGPKIGTIGLVMGIIEKDVNLQIGLKLYRLLKASNADVLITRTEDVDVDFSVRVADANRLKADAFISIHNNAIPNNNNVGGTETYYGNDVPGSLILAKSVHKGMVEEVKLADRKVGKRPDLYVLRSTVVPSILVEVAYLSNQKEEELLSMAWFQNRAAVGIYKGLLDYLSQSARRPESNSAIDSATKTSVQ